VAGTIGVLQASEALKEILGVGKSMAGRLLLFNALGPSFEVVELRRNLGCPLCGNQPSIHELIDYPLACPAAPA
jgi:adenylyltransferase/sulfurtransferase